MVYRWAGVRVAWVESVVGGCGTEGENEGGGGGVAGRRRIYA